MNKKLRIKGHNNSSYAFVSTHTFLKIASLFMTLTRQLLFQYLQEYSHKNSNLGNEAIANTLHDFSEYENQRNSEKEEKTHK